MRGVSLLSLALVSGGCQTGPEPAGDITIAYQGDGAFADPVLFGASITTSDGTFPLRGAGFSPTDALGTPNSGAVRIPTIGPLRVVLALVRSPADTLVSWRRSFELNGVAHFSFYVIGTARPVPFGPCFGPEKVPFGGGADTMAVAWAVRVEPPRRPRGSDLLPPSC